MRGLGFGLGKGLISRLLLGGLRVAFRMRFGEFGLAWDKFAPRCAAGLAVALKSLWGVVK